MKAFPLLIISLLSLLFADAQYISRSEPIPYSCPSICQGGTITLKIPQVQNLNSGDTIYALLSNANGSFSSGTTALKSSQYSLNTGTNWITGPFTFSSNLNDLYFNITIPVSVPLGNGYTIKMKSSSGYVAADLFQCGANGFITITSAYPTLPSLLPQTTGSNQWIGHVYTWVATTNQLLTTPNLVSAQNFFDTQNYKGHFLKDSLSFDIDYNSATGGTCPGTPGGLNNGTSIPCSQAYSTNFSIRLLNKYNFPAGTYKLELQGDDGIRLSIDGGSTWLLNSFLEQKYADGYQSTAANYPNGICLSGNTDLVIEYFQRNVDSRLTFRATLLSSTAISDAGNQSACTGGNVAFYLNNSSALSYQWYYSNNGGSSFDPVPSGTPFSGADSCTLMISNVQNSYNNYLFRCQISGLCGNPVNTAVDTLFVGGQGASVNLTADKNIICPGDSAILCAPANGTSYLWNTGATTRCIAARQAGNYYATINYNSGCTAQSNHLPISTYPVSSISITVIGDTLAVFSGVSQQWYEGDNIISGATSKVYLAQHSGSYSVLITDSNGCQARSNPIQVNETGINELNDGTNFIVFPNPSPEQISVQIKTGNELINHELHIYDTEGRCVAKAKIISNTTELDITTFALGLYFIKIDGAVQKFIKQ